MVHGYSIKNFLPFYVVNRDHFHVCTFNPLYTNIQYNNINCYNDNLNGTKPFAHDETYCWRYSRTIHAIRKFTVADIKFRITFYQISTTFVSWNNKEWKPFFINHTTLCWNPLKWQTQQQNLWEQSLLLQQVSSVYTCDCIRSSFFEWSTYSKGQVSDSQTGNLDESPHSWICFKSARSCTWQMGWQNMRGPTVNLGRSFSPTKP